MLLFDTWVDHHHSNKNYNWYQIEGELKLIFPNSTTAIHSYFVVFISSFVFILKLIRSENSHGVVYCRENQILTRQCSTWFCSKVYTSDLLSKVLYCFIPKVCSYLKSLKYLVRKLEEATLSYCLQKLRTVASPLLSYIPTYSVRAKNKVLLFSVFCSTVFSFQCFSYPSGFKIGAF